MRRLVAVMAPHLCVDELARVRSWQFSGAGAMEVWRLHQEHRRQRRVQPLCLTAMRKVLRGLAYNKSMETRGRKRKLGDRAVAAIDRKRKELVANSGGVS